MKKWKGNLYIQKRRQVRWRIEERNFSRVTNLRGGRWQKVHRRLLKRWQEWPWRLYLTWKRKVWNVMEKWLIERIWSLNSTCWCHIRGSHEKGKEGWKRNIIFRKLRHYSGEFKDDFADGRGVFEYEDGRKYVGEVKKSIAEGFGVFTWPDGRKFEG